MAEELLRLEGISTSSSGGGALSAVSLSVFEGSTVRIVGPNGSGKTTLLNVISGFTRPSAGSLRFRGASLDGMPPNRRAALGLGRLWQDARVFTSLTVTENVLLAEQKRSTVKTLQFLAGSPSRYSSRRISELVDWFGLGGVSSRLAGELSGGEQRLLAVVCVIARNPLMLLLDEPFASLDDWGAMRVGEALLAATRRGAGVLIVEHQSERAATLGGSLRVLVGGRLAVPYSEHAARVAGPTEDD